MIKWPFYSQTWLSTQDPSPSLPYGLIKEGDPGTITIIITTKKNIKCRNCGWGSRDKRNYKKEKVRITTTSSSDTRERGHAISIQIAQGQREKESVRGEETYNLLSSPFLSLFKDTIKINQAHQGLFPHFQTLVSIIILFATFFLGINKAQDTTTMV